MESLEMFSETLLPVIESFSCNLNLGKNSKSDNNYARQFFGIILRRTIWESIAISLCNVILWF